MKKTKLLQSLYSLQESERKKWFAFVKSPLVHARCDVALLAALIEQDLQEPSIKSLDKTTVFEALFGQAQPYDELKLNNTVSDLYGLLLDFLSFQHHASDALQKQADVVSALIARHLDKQAASEHRKWRILLDQHPQKDGAWMRFEALWWETLDLLHHRQARQPTGEYLLRQAEATFKAQQLDNMRLAISALSRGTLAISPSQEPPAWFRQIEALLPQSEDANALPAHRLYLATLRLLREPDELHFGQLTRLLEAYPQALPQADRLALYQCAVNFCIRRINDGKTEAYADVLRIYQQLVDQQLLLQNGVLSQWAYKNVATAGLRTGEFIWTQQFLTSHSRYLPEAERESALAFNLASLHFEKGDFTEALRTLQGIDFKDITYHLGAKILQLKIFYITREFETLRAFSAATRRLIRRSRSLSEFGKTTNLNFLSALQQLAKLADKSPNKQQRRLQWKAIYQKIDETHPLANKDWLLKMSSGPSNEQ